MLWGYTGDTTFHRRLFAARLFSDDVSQNDFSPPTLSQTTFHRRPFHNLTFHQPITYTSAEARDSFVLMYFHIFVLHSLVIAFHLNNQYIVTYLINQFDQPI
ncbi:MAG: hypothetical protein GY820_09615 [Gammaproteobacteria bacterium]|nr:hypothetical protein [Gammaproteobacteria bacterium]